MVSLRAIERLLGLASTEVQIFARDLEAQLRRIEEDRERLIEEEDSIPANDGIEMEATTTSTTTSAPTATAPTTSTSATSAPIFMSTASPATMSGGSLQVISPAEAEAAQLIHAVL